VFFYFTGPYPTIGFSKETEAGNRRLASTSSALEDNPPAYSQATRTTTSGSSPSRVVSLSRSRQGEVPFSAPINGLQMATRRDSIRGSWSLDPLAPQVLPAQDLVQMYGQGDTKRRCCDYRWSKKKVPATAMFRSRHGKTYMQRSALSEGRLSVPLRRFARRRAAEVRFSSM